MFMDEWFWYSNANDFVILACHIFITLLMIRNMVQNFARHHSMLWFFMDAIMHIVYDYVFLLLLLGMVSYIANPFQNATTAQQDYAFIASYMLYWWCIFKYYHARRNKVV